jgi:hypothetical protein
MATQEKKPILDPATETTAETQGLWAKLNALGERHAKVIIFASSLLIILTVVIFAKVFYDRTLAERAAREVSQADTAEKLVTLKEKYKDTPVAAEITYRLGNLYYESGKLDEAKKEFEEFKSRFPTHPLKFFVDKAYTTLVANQKFLEEDKEKRVKVRTLQTHPEERAKVRQLLAALPDEQKKNLDTSTIFYGPTHEPESEVDFQVDGKGTFRVRLFDDELPLLVANFLKLVEEKAFDGVAFEKNGDILKLSKKVDFVVPFEKTDRVPAPSDIVLAVRKLEGKDQAAGATIEFLLKPAAADLKDAAILGEVIEYWPVVQELSTQSLKTVTVQKGRSGKIEPQRTKTE